MKTFILLLLPPVWATSPPDPTDFSWVKRWAAVGDSFTAGIGSGVPLGNFFNNAPSSNWYCSRYDTAYPMIMNDAFGASVEDFQYLACSGDRTGGIYNQIKALEEGLDLVVFTAGGNDLCLSSMIKECVFLPFDGEAACTKVINIAQNNLNTILKPNLQQLLDALDKKMNKGSVVIIVGYAQFFNTQDEACSTDQDWTLINFWGQEGLPLTISRRKTFNDLVVQINNVLEGVVDEANLKGTYNSRIGFANWDPWPQVGVQGQFCDPSSSGQYPDPEQPDLQFFKFSTDYENVDHDELDEVGPSNDSLTQWQRYSRSLDETIQAKAEHEMTLPIYKSKAWQPKGNAKFPSRAYCPGDADVDVQPPSIGLPDFIGKNFHPNEQGHYTIASFALQTIIDVRAQVLGEVAPECEPTDKFTCWGNATQAYVSEKRLNANYEDFCRGVARPTGQSGWSYSKTYDHGTPDEVQFLISLNITSTNYDQNECIESMERIINGCDGNDPNNPMDWKFGGQWIRGDYTYQVNPINTQRAWPIPQSATGTCEGWYHLLFTSYEIQGAGWASYNYGQDSLLSSARSCVGSGGITNWKFDYYDKPTKDGYEWKATFNTPIWVRRRCFDNNKVQLGAGGFTNGCAGND
ncbi:hypothetical protein ASPZODRAFT_76607 [Penicilliopsis zonata CBS 506.65]|uniref:SGNH hydrolase-type esterase domain-containing protein n=1 Tax=Penicilliopsis zonata CBS 506.65 TaxID=1073090 RepID=A0A1L9S5U7_9EURO|nr:hypothetical protein ASPZODRAFT_76607 [Penicilliopsis zonata CBS 506.65]OJJ42538.1 hypothetical protein ASPZODRAFT_76607 [Penicilliopsis zonata CBS 506.65]